MQETFSFKNRKSITHRLRTETYDLLVVGGGITGVGIALDAVNRGLKTALIEKGDFASGTSSRSTKLIHGGLRYLKQLELGLVQETGSERAIVYKNARHIVRPERMLLPIIENGSLGKFSTSIALMVYDLLAGVKKNEKKRMLSAKETLAAEPMLRRDVVTGGGLYYEYRTDDARLVIEVVKTAVSMGLDCLNYLQLSHFNYDQSQKVIGGTVFDSIDELSYSIRAKNVINACGPWVDDLREKDKSIGKKRLHLTKGVHLVIPYKKIPLKQSVYFDVGDGRMIFCIPREEITYIGTTDTNYKADKDQPDCTATDVEYLLKAVNDMFPEINLSADDISSSWSGLRPLIHEEGKSPSELSRKDEIFVSESGVVSIAGGKLTAYRKMAERAVDLIINRLDKSRRDQLNNADTEHLRLSGGDFNSNQDLEFFMVELIEDFRETGIDVQQLKKWVYRYGRNAAQIVVRFSELRGSDMEAKAAALLAELTYGIEHEMIAKPLDFIVRRSGMLYFDREMVEETVDLIIEKMSAEFGWSKELKQQYKAEVLEESRQAIAFKQELAIEA